MCSFAENLRGFQDVFIFSKDNNCDGDHVMLHGMLKSAEDRTRAVGEVIKCLAGKELIPGIRNEVLLEIDSLQCFPFCVFFSFRMLE